MWQVALCAAVAALMLGAQSGGAQRSGPNEWDADPDFFPIVPWDSLRDWAGSPGTREKVIESIADCDFTVSAFALPADLELISRLGLKAIVHRPTDGAPWRKKWIDVTEQEIESAVEKWVRDAGGSDCILGYYLVDEPGTPKFEPLGRAVEALGRHAPGKLAYINLFPGYATIGAPDKSQLGAASFTDYLEQFVERVRPQMLSYDNYMVTYSDDLLDPARAALYYRDLVEVRRVSQKHGIPFWNTVCSNRIRPGTPPPSPANLLFQAYTTLAAGGRGLAWFTYCDHGYAYAPVDNEGNRSHTWHYLKMVNNQVRMLGPVLNRLRSTGVYFSDPPPDEGLPLLPGRVIGGVESRPSAGSDSGLALPVMVGEFEGEDGQDYAMIVNLSLERSANIRIRTVEAREPKEVIVSRDRAPAALDEVNGHWLVPGQGVLIRLAVSRDGA